MATLKELKNLNGRFTSFGLVSPEVYIQSGCGGFIWHPGEKKIKFTAWSLDEWLSFNNLDEGFYEGCHNISEYCGEFVFPDADREPDMLDAIGSLFDLFGK